MIVRNRLLKIDYQKLIGKSTIKNRLAKIAHINYNRKSTVKNRLHVSEIDCEKSIPYWMNTRRLRQNSGIVDHSCVHPIWNQSISDNRFLTVDFRLYVNKICQSICDNRFLTEDFWIIDINFGNRLLIIDV